ncbi:MAG: sensor histidine kinase [Chloroflexi bacterium]|nr:sensor histidine kinase [Chloroflexota bacterium]
MSTLESSITRFARALVERRERSVYLWAIVLYVLLVSPLVPLLTAADQPWPKRLAAAILVVAFAGLDWMVLRRHSEWQTRVSRMVPFFLIQVALTALLVEFEHSYILLFLLVSGYAYRYLPVRWGFVVAMAVIAVVMGEQILPALPLTSAESLLQAIARSTWVFFGILIVGWIAQQSRVSRERQRMIEELNATQGKLAAAERQAGVLEERARLAREIHDTLAQGLVSIVMHLEAAEQALPDGTSATSQHLDQARRAARENLAEARRFVWALQPEALERDALPKALERTAARWTEESRIPVAVSVTGSPCPLPPESEVTLLRAAQEALVNVSKHARARQAMLTLSYMDDRVMMDVNDDGIGFDLTLISSEREVDGFGLAGMRQRVERLGGHLSIESAVGEGTTLVVEIPLGARGEEGA